MLRSPESNTPFWRSSWCGGLGCWWRSSRIRFMGISLHSGGEAALLTALLHSVVRSHQVRKPDRFSAALRAEGGDHRPFRHPDGYLCPLYQPSPNVARGGLKDALRNPYSPECVELEFSEVRAAPVLC